MVGARVAAASTGRPAPDGRPWRTSSGVRTSVIPRDAKWSVSCASSARTSAGRTPSAVSCAHASKTAPPGAHTERRGASSAPPASTTSAVLRTGGRCSRPRHSSTSAAIALPRGLDRTVVAEQAQPVLQLGEVGEGPRDVVRTPPGDTPHVRAVQGVDDGRLGEVRRPVGGDVRGGGADLLEPHRAVRVGRPRLGQLDQIGGVVLGGGAGRTVPLRCAVEHPGVHGRHGAEPGGLGGRERMAVAVPRRVVLGVQMHPPGRTAFAGRQHPLQPCRGLAA